MKQFRPVGLDLILQHHSTFQSAGTGSLYIPSSCGARLCVHSGPQTLKPKLCKPSRPSQSFHPRVPCLGIPKALHTKHGILKCPEPDGPLHPKPQILDLLTPKILNSLKPETSNSEPVNPHLPKALQQKS